MSANVLSRDDACRAAAIFAKVGAHGLRDAALTGGLAIEAQLAAHGGMWRKRRLNDLDLVVESFAGIPCALASRFLVHHIHADAAPGKTLLQLVDRELGLRIDFFRAFGSTLERAETIDGPAGPIQTVSIEDLAARATSYVFGRLRQSRPVEWKHADAFRRLRDLGAPEKRDAAWNDHRQEIEETFAEAARQAEELLQLHPELLVDEKYSRVVIPCDRCCDSGPFRRAEPEAIVGALGYW